METGHEKGRLEGHKHFVTSVAISPDGKTIVSGSCDNTVCIWDMEMGKKSRYSKYYHQRVKHVVVSPDGKTIVSSDSEYGYGDKGTRQAWDMKTGQEKSMLEEYNGFHNYDFEHSYFAHGYDFENTICVKNSETDELRWELEGHTAPVNSVAISPDGESIVSGSSDKTVRVWDMETGREKCRMEGHIGEVQSIAISPDGKTIVSGSDDGTVRVWDLEAAKLWRS